MKVLRSSLSRFVVQKSNLNCLVNRRFSVDNQSKADQTKNNDTNDLTNSITNLEIASKYCQEQVRKFDYYTYFVGLYYPKKLQKHYYAINALFLEVLKSRDVSREISICQTRLLWWEQQINSVIDGSVIAREPIAQVLKVTKEETKINFNLLTRMVDYQLFDIERGDITTMGELEVYAENTRSLLLYMNLHLLNIDNSDALSAASHIGRCLGICDIIKKTPFYIAKHKNYIPVEILNKHNLRFDTIWNPRREGLVNDEFYDVILEVAAYAKKHLELGREFASKLPAQSHRALLLAIEAEKFLQDLETHNFDIFDEKFRKKSVFKLPYRIHKAAKKNYY